MFAEVWNKMSYKLYFHYFKHRKNPRCETKCQNLSCIFLIFDLVFLSLLTLAYCFRFWKVRRPF